MVSVRIIVEVAAWVNFVLYAWHAPVPPEENDYSRNYKNCESRRVEAILLLRFLAIYRDVNVLFTRSPLI